MAAISRPRNDGVDTVVVVPRNSMVSSVENMLVMIRLTMSKLITPRITPSMSRATKRCHHSASGAGTPGGSGMPIGEL
ncbi:hypothetical protein Aph01nite_20310 [Acrocarpospora phusangensis]|uniref:Uncharacterized protein n=1 Tax=Acrocarpospora phusangensis TaxID=1070424 RepID=A0A919Q909_9ACTN|nr:hypothetical protein Aph01nite_20310 [Acrocarpospora phusangensis]